MKKALKIAIPILLILVVAVSSIIYFSPMPIVTLQDSNMVISSTRLVFENSTPEIKSQVFNELTDTQTKEITNILNKCNYTRTFYTLFPPKSYDGASHSLIISTTKDNINNVLVLESNNILYFDGKLYNLSNSEKTIQDIWNVLNS